MVMAHDDERNHACDPGRVFSAQLHKKRAKSGRLESFPVQALYTVGYA